MLNGTICSSLPVPEPRSTSKCSFWARDETATPGCHGDGYKKPMTEKQLITKTRWTKNITEPSITDGCVVCQSSFQGSSRRIREPSAKSARKSWRFRCYHRPHLPSLHQHHMAMVKTTVASWQASGDERDLPGLFPAQTMREISGTTRAKCWVWKDGEKDVTTWVLLHSDTAGWYSL